MKQQSFVPRYYGDLSLRLYWFHMIRATPCGTRRKSSTVLLHTLKPTNRKEVIIIAKAPGESRLASVSRQKPKADYSKEWAKNLSIPIPDADTTEEPKLSIRRICTGVMFYGSIVIIGGVSIGIVLSAQQMVSGLTSFLGTVSLGVAVIIGTQRPTYKG